MTDRRLGAALVVGGAALALGLQVVAPVGVPLYDGVEVIEPYRYLHPVSGQAGDPTSFNATLEVTGGVSPTIAARTGEQPPQAQLIGQRASFDLTSGASAIVASITPIEPPTQPTSGQILGNAYRFSVTDQSGDELHLRSCSGCVSLVLRAPEGSPSATLMRFENGTWTPLDTLHAGTVALYQTNPTATGIFAVVSTSETGGGGGFDVVLLLAVAGVALIFVAFVALLYMRARPARLPVAEFRRGEVARPPARTPSKRRRSKRRPSGRSGS